MWAAIGKSGKSTGGIIRDKIRKYAVAIAPNERKITAGEATKLLFFNGDETWWLDTTWRPESSIPGGNELHRRLGYHQDETFVRYYHHKGLEMMVKTVGEPDKLNIEGNEVLELKTYRYPCNRARQIVAGQFQAMFYCWLTGFEYYQVHLYNAVTGKMEEKIKGNLDLRDFRKKLDWAIDLQNLEFARANNQALFGNPIKQFA
jgi:hypothetical protein